MEKTLYIYGCSGVGKSIVDTVARLNANYDEQIFVDDDEHKHSNLFYGYNVISRQTLEQRSKPSDDIIVAYFKPVDIFTRGSKLSELKETVKAKFVTIIDPNATISPSASIGEGVYIAPNAVVDSDAKIGDHSIILFNTVVSREVSLAKSTFLSAGVVVKGSVVVAASSFVSANAVITKNVYAHTFINASLLVNHEVSENCIVSSKSDTISVPLTQNIKRAEKKLRFFHP